MRMHRMHGMAGLRPGVGHVWFICDLTACVILLMWTHADRHTYVEIINGRLAPLAQSERHVPQCITSNYIDVSWHRQRAWSRFGGQRTMQ